MTAPWARHSPYLILVLSFAAIYLYKLFGKPHSLARTRHRKLDTLYLIYHRRWCEQWLCSTP